MKRHKRRARHNGLSYALAAFGGSLPGLIVSMLLAIYLTDTLALPVLAAGILMLLLRLLEGLAAPLAGYGMDRWTTGPRTLRRIFAVCGPLLCLSFASLFLAQPLGGAGRIAWCLASYLLFTGALNVLEIAALPLLESFETRESRLTGNALRIGGSLLAALLAALFALWLTGSRSAAGTAAPLPAALALAALLWGGLRFRGEAREEDAKPPASLRAALRIVLGERTIFLLLGSHLLLNTALALWMQSGIYCVTYRPGSSGITALLFLSPLAFALLAQPLVLYVSRRIPQRALLVSGSLLAAAGMAAQYLCRSLPILGLLCGCLTGLAAAFPANLVYTRMQDLVERLAVRREQRLSGAAHSLLVLASRAGWGVAGFLLACFLRQAAYVPGAVQGDAALEAISASAWLLPAISLAAGGVMASLSFRSQRQQISLRRLAAIAKKLERE